jgi:cell division septation protein DedD
VAASDVPVQDEYYRVLLNYDSDRTLEQARTVVPDAYVINLSQGARIQMGAFKKESEAQTLVEQLRQQGISASINRP